MAVNNVEGGQINSPIFDFRNKIGDLARPNLFQVELTFPQLTGTANIGGSGGAADAAETEAASAPLGGNLATLLVKAANIPGKCAAPPAPAIITLNPLSTADFAYFVILRGVLCADSILFS